MRIFLLFLIFLGTSLFGDGINVWSVERKVVPISITEIYHQISERVRQTTISLYQTKEVVLNCKSCDFSLGEIYQNARNDDKIEPFLRKGKKFLINDVSNEVWYYLFIEDGAQRLQIAPLEKLSDSLFLISDMPALSKSREILNIFQETENGRRCCRSN